MQKQEAYKTIEQFLFLMNYAEKQNCQLFESLKNLESEQDDLIHKIEFLPVVDSEKLITRIKEIRNKRRKIKDRMEYFYPIKQFSKENKNIKEQIERIMTEMASVDKLQTERVYKIKTEDSYIENQEPLGD